MPMPPTPARAAGDRGPHLTMQLACVVAIDMTWPFRGDADRIEDPEEAAPSDQREKTAIERNPEDFVRIIELTGMRQPEGRAEIAVRGAVETLIKADDDLLEHPPQDAIKAALQSGGDGQRYPVAEVPLEGAVQSRGMCGVAGGREGCAERVERRRLGSALARNTEAQGPPNHPPDDDAHPLIRQMTGRHDQPVMGHQIDHAIEGLGIARLACSSLRSDRSVYGRAQQRRYRARCPNNPGLR